MPAQKQELARLEAQTQQADFWNDRKEAEKVFARIRQIKNLIAQYEKAHSRVDELKIAYELWAEGEMDEQEVEAAYQQARKELDELELNTVLSSEEDALGAVLTIKPGAGGTESQDWAEMLMRMYLRWGERQGYKVRVADLQRGEVAGIKAATLIFEGDYAFGKLKGESGVHRLVRISPFDANKRRHTSFAGVFVTPLVDESIEIEINPADLEWDTFRASGPGGQHVNKNESAVRVKHIPTGIVVECQQERSQHRNRELALKILKSKLYELELQKRREKQQELEKQKKKIEWGSQIRSYVLYPYKMIKDLRTGYETSNVEAVLDGDIDEFLRAYLLSGTAADAEKSS